MSLDVSEIRDDLAYVRRLVGGGDGYPQSFGRAYFLAGAIYLAQMGLSAALSVGWLPATPPVTLSVGFVPTAVFLVCLTVILARAPRAGTGLATRAFGAFFGAMGLANVVLAVVVGWVAVREKSFTTWLVFPCAVFVLQGAAWLAAAIMMRRAWMGLVTAVWIVSAGAMAATIGSTPFYILAAAGGLAFGMAAPGLWMMRRPAST